MKKLSIFLIISLLASSMIFAQRREVRNANRNLQRGNIAEAYGHIKTAIEDDRTGVDPATWLLKTDILMQISLSEDPEVRNLVENPALKAEETLKKGEELDEDNQNMLEIAQKWLFLSEVMFNEGVQDFENQSFETASVKFLRSFEIGTELEAADTLAIYYAGYTAQLAGDLDKAMEHLITAHEIGFDEPDLFSSIVNIALSQRDMEKAEKWINKGREAHPEDLNLIFIEVNVHLQTGNTAKAKEALELAIEKDPENANLHYVFAVNFDQMASDTTLTEEERNYAFEQAEIAYLRAIELNPDYFDAIFNLGAMHFNKGIKMFVEAETQLRKDMDFAAYDKKEKKIKEQWLRAQPFMEKAKDMLEPEDDNFEMVLRSLRELYARTEQKENLEEINKIYRDLFGGGEEEE